MWSAASEPVPSTACFPISSNDYHDSPPLVWHITLFPGLFVYIYRWSCFFRPPLLIFLSSLFPAAMVCSWGRQQPAHTGRIMEHWICSVHASTDSGYHYGRDRP